MTIDERIADATDELTQARTKQINAIGWGWSADAAKYAEQAVVAKQKLIMALEEKTNMAMANITPSAIPGV